MRFFRANYNYDDKAIIINENEIVKKYNPYGLYWKDNGDRIDENDFEEIGNNIFRIEKEYLEDNLNIDINCNIYKVEIQNEDDDEIEYLIVNKEQKDNLIELGNYTDKMEEYVLGNAEIYTELNNQNEVDELTTIEEFYGEDGYNGYECYSYWNGHNWIEIAFNEDWDEVTYEFEGWDNRINLNYSNRNDVTGTDYYAIKNSEGKWKTIKETWSIYQGEMNEYDEVTDLNECLSAFENITIEDETLQDYVDSLIKTKNNLEY